MHTSLLSLLAFTTLGLSTAHPNIYFIRHGEKPQHGGIGLSDDGLERAECIRDVFGSHSNYDIGYIMAQKPKKSGKRNRPYETVRPLAEDLDIKVDISCNRDDPKCVKKTIKKYKGKGNILICWEHHRMTDLVEVLGNEDAPEYPDERFDLIWTIPYPYNDITEIVSESCPGLDWSPDNWNKHDSL